MTWKLLTTLAALLAASVLLNLWQWKRSIEAPLEGRIAGLERVVDDAEAILEDKTSTARRTATEARAAAKQLASAADAYRAATVKRPLTPANCAPGQDRVDATNLALGSSAPTEK